jgi:penicillin-binding protein 2
VPRLRLLLTVAASLLLLACTQNKQPTKPVAQQSATPPPQATAEEVAKRYFQLWSTGKYAEMYDLLSAGSRQAIAKDRYTGRHEGIADEARMTAVKVESAGPVQDGGDRTAAPYRVTYTTSIWGDVKQENSLPMVKEAEGWRVEWSPSLIFRELKGANLVRAVVDAPKRGAILDRNGQALAVTGSVPTVGTAKNLINVPSIVPDRNGLINQLAGKLGLSPQEIKGKVDDPKTEIDVFIPLKTLPANTPQQQIDELEATPGVVVQRTARRIYPYGLAAAHVIGYIAPISAEQLQRLKGQGYQDGDLVGAVGLEEAYEEQLAGQRGARLTIITPEGGPVAELAKRPGKAPQDVVTTIEINAQIAMEQALGDRTGSAVLLDPRDNTVVAMASHPSFDPNTFTTGIPSEDALKLLNDPRNPFLNRAIGATYPPGSTFKVITAAAGLEKAGFTSTSRVECVPVWNGLGPANAKKNWSNVNEGPLTIAESLMRSCNPTFYEIGLKLDRTDPNILTQFAAAFGFGASTGINGLEDAAGVDPGPEWKQKNLNEGWFSGDSVNLSIGQGFMLATPLQIANAYSAIAGSAGLRTPLLVRELRDSATKQPSEQYAVKELGKLPISQNTLNILRQGTTMVAQDPRGTAYSVFAGSRLDPAGKSGTAEDQGLQSHALFAAYAPRSAPRGVAVVVLDEGQSGSLEAGPITRRILESWVLR